MMAMIIKTISTSATAPHTITALTHAGVVVDDAAATGGPVTAEDLINGYRKIIGWCIEDLIINTER